MTTITRDTLVGILDNLAAKTRAELLAMRATVSTAPARGDATEHARSIVEGTLRVARTAHGARESLHNLLQGIERPSAAAKSPSKKRQATDS